MSPCLLRQSRDRIRSACNEIGDAKSVLSAPRHPYTRKLIAAVPTIDRRREHFELDTRQVPSLVRPLGFEPGPAKWDAFGPDHRVRVEA